MTEDVETRDGAGAQAPGAVPAAYQVLAQVRPLYQAAGRAVDQALRGTDLTVPLRAVLELVLDRGPMTVPQLAREFGVTRQSVQALVDTGAARGLLDLADNPQHRRSRLVAATGSGRRTFDEVHGRELAALDRVTADLDAEDLVSCARVLTLLTDRIRQLSDEEPT
ncbi:MarR family transcriptional regulator [Modestobacter sp. VKM Ac-2986]|uniref:MarR family winged helix-turn-helix transcriptional regulator n=1 Tax=Modestobacter sp. VKM Ac-2986 TaxID=3004140 RepID=UPI0022AA68E6|nr:MarR family transcriptional regulator [Modestobacter sp. VKM Ac-2986]MCZ2828116.1 MarR family transcriptional regulator [Modestobacter sp. VKM Ac-2986]